MKGRRYSYKWLRITILVDFTEDIPFPIKVVNYPGLYTKLQKIISEVNAAESWEIPNTKEVETFREIGFVPENTRLELVYNVDVGAKPILVIDHPWVDKISVKRQPSQGEFGIFIVINNF